MTKRNPHVAQMVQDISTKNMQGRILGLAVIYLDAKEGIKISANGEITALCIGASKLHNDLREAIFSHQGLPPPPKDQQL